MMPIDVKPLDGYKIKVSFSDGSNGIVELGDFIQKGIFRTLLNKDLFNDIYIRGSAIGWSDELEIDADTIYAEIQHKEPADLFHIPH